MSQTKVTDNLRDTTQLDGAKITTGTIPIARIADDAITLAKMAPGTDGQILTYDASGNPVAVGPGTDGQVLTSTGAGSPPAFEDATGGVDGIVSSANATAITIDSDEKVGIGITNPNSTLVVSDGGAYGMEFYPNDSNVSKILAYDRSGSAYRDFKISGNQIILGYGTSGGNESMRVDSSGNVLIGTTSHTRGSVDIRMADSTNANGNSTTSSSDWTHRVGLRLDSRCNVIGEIGPMIEFSTSGNPEALIGLVNHTQTGTQQGALVFVVKHTTNNTDMAERMRILPSGNTGIGTNNPSHILHISAQGRSTSSSWATSSDERVKENIADHDPALDTINKLRPVKFNFKKSYRPDAKDSETGFIAQEFEKVVPGSVTIVENEKNGDEVINDFNVLSTECLTPMLVKAVQELTQQVADLKAEIETLKG